MNRGEPEKVCVKPKALKNNKEIVESGGRVTWNTEANNRKATIMRSGFNMPDGIEI